MAHSDAYRQLHDRFVSLVHMHLPVLAFDELRQVCKLPARKRPAAIRGWTRHWRIDTGSMRLWAREQVEVWETYGPEHIAVKDTWDREIMSRGPLSFDSRAEYVRAVADWANEEWSVTPRSGPIYPEPTEANFQHCEWLVRYQVKREPFSAIARDVKKERQSVAEAVKNVARLLGLSLRSPSGGGRPKKPKT